MKKKSTIQSSMDYLSEHKETYMPLTPIYGREEFRGSLRLSEAILPETPVAPDSVYQIIKNELCLDSRKEFNLATFCNEATTDPWGERLVTENIMKNFIDHTEYPGTNLSEKRSIQMIAKELGTTFDPNPSTSSPEIYGAATIGSSEAVMLALIAHKFVWNLKQRVLLNNIDTIGIKVDPRDRPVVLMSSQVHGCWDKFCRYYDAIPLYIEINEPPYAIHDAAIISEILNTDIDNSSSKYAAEIRKRIGYAEAQTGRKIGELVMCVGTVVETTFTGNYDNIPAIDDAVDKFCNTNNAQYTKKQKKDFDSAYLETYNNLYPNQKTAPRIPDFTDIPIHVDAASSGFVLMFSTNGKGIKYNFDDCKKRVRSINISNHKFGMTFPGMGSIIFKDNTVVDKSLVYDIAYLGGHFTDYTVNFSRGSSMIIMQYYNLLRFGRSGYKAIMDNCLVNTSWFIEQLKQNKTLSLYLENISNINIEGDEIYLPIIALTKKKSAPIHKWTLTDLSDKLAQTGWVVPAYNIPRNSPEDTDGIAVLRIVVQQVVSRDKLNMLLEHMETAISDLSQENYKGQGAKHKNRRTLC